MGTATTQILLLQSQLARLEYLLAKARLLEAKEYNADWLGHDQKVTRDGSGRFASSGDPSPPPPKQVNLGNFMKGVNIAQPAVAKLDERLTRIANAETAEAATDEIVQLGKDAIPVAAQFLLMGVAPEVLFGATLTEGLTSALLQRAIAEIATPQYEKIENPVLKFAVQNAAGLAAGSFVGSATKTGLQAATEVFGAQAIAKAGEEKLAPIQKLTQFLPSQESLMKLIGRSKGDLSAAEQLLQTTQMELADAGIKSNVGKNKDVSELLSEIGAQLEKTKAENDALGKSLKQWKQSARPVKLVPADLERIQKLFSKNVEQNLAAAGIDPQGARDAAVRLLNRTTATVGDYKDAEFKYMRQASYDRFEKAITDLSSNMRDTGSIAAKLPTNQWRVRAIRAEVEHGTAVDAFQEQMIRVGRARRANALTPYDEMPKLIDRQFHDGRDQLAEYLQALNPGQKGSTIKTMGETFPEGSPQREALAVLLRKDLQVYDTAITIGERRTRDAMEVAMKKHLEDVASVSATPLQTVTFSSKSGPGDAYYVSLVHSPDTAKLMAENGIDVKGIIDERPQRTVRETGVLQGNNTWHEAGHHIEDMLNLEEPSMRWMLARASGAPQPMEGISAGGQPVMAHPDDFQREYVGRIYKLSSEEAKAGKVRGSTEVISTALESWADVFKKDYLARYGDSLEANRRNGQEAFEAIGSNGLYEHLEIDREHLMYGLDALVKGNK